MKEKPLPVSLQQFTNELNAIAYSAGRYVEQVFRDWLQMTVCALSMQSMEDLYMETVKHYADKGLAGRMAKLFAALVNVMEDERRDVLGDIFMESVSRGNNGQFFTPLEVSRLMAKMAGIPATGSPSVLDPACGSGRMLLMAAEINPRCILVGQDNDHTCVQMLAVNLSLNGLQGYAVHGNSLTNEIWKVYKIGMPGIPGVIYQVSYSFMCSQLERKSHEDDSEKDKADDSEPYEAEKTRTGRKPLLHNPSTRRPSGHQPAPQRRTPAGKKSNSSTKARTGELQTASPRPLPANIDLGPLRQPTLFDW